MMVIRYFLLCWYLSTFLLHDPIARIRLDGTRLFKVHLDKTQQTNIEHKTDTFAGVYKKLTGKEVTFEFPEPYL